MKTATPLLLPTLICHAFSIAGARARESSDAYPMPRDVTVSDLVESYSPQENCRAEFLERFTITSSDCAARVALAKTTCPALIVEGLPDVLDEKHVYRLMGRSKVCVLTTIWGRPYNGAAADRAADRMWAKDHGG
jgi:hypothetical protein